MPFTLGQSTSYLLNIFIRPWWISGSPQKRINIKHISNTTKKATILSFITFPPFNFLRKIYKTKI